MNNLLEHLKIRTFKVIFLCQKLIESFQKNSMKNIRLEDQVLLKNVFEIFDFYDILFSKIVPNFCRLCS